MKTPTGKQPTLSEFEEKKPRTYGDYLVTREARADSDARIRKYINHTLKEQPGFKLVKYARGPPGTLDYGRAVMMFAHPPGDLAKELNKMRKRKDKDNIWIVKVDFGKMTRLFGKTEHMFPPIQTYISRAAAEKKYNEEVYYFLKQGGRK
jgi:hypothetical protein